MKTWHMVIDVALCHDCNNCFLADKDEFVGNDFPPYSVGQPWSGHRWMDIERKERGQYPIVQVAYLPMPCMHCGEAGCVEASADAAVYRREDGLVIIDPEKAKGRREIVATCPYGRIYWNEEADLPQKCTGCAHLMDGGWTETRCSQVCPTGAIRLVFADGEEMAALTAVEGLRPLRPDVQTRPRVLYKNLHRWDKVFVAASVVYRDTDDCAVEARARVRVEGVPRGAASTDAYGQFVIDGLDPGSVCEVLVEATGYKTFFTGMKLDKSENLGTIFLDKK